MDDSLEGLGPEIRVVKSNTLIGILGALIGAIIGGAIWVGVYQIGFIVYFAGIAIVAFSYKGYTLLSKGNAYKAAVISIIISIIVLLCSQYLCWGIEIYKAFSAEFEINFWDALISVPEFAFSEELIFDFFKETVIGLIIIAFSGAAILKKAKKANGLPENNPLLAKTN